jgi:hypothetical protein
MEKCFYNFLQKSFFSFYVLLCIFASAQSNKISTQIISDKVLIPVMDDKGLYGYKNDKGQIKIKSQFIWADTLVNNRALIRMDDGKFAIINETGLILKKLPYPIVKPFKEDLALVKLENKYGYINRQGNVVIEIKYYQAHYFSNGFAVVCPLKDGSNNADVVINKKGDVVFDFQKNEMSSVPFFEFFSEDLIGFMKNEDRKMGFMNTKFEEVISPQFEYVEFFKEGYVKCLDKNNFYLVNKKGKSILSQNYTWAEPFSEGLACVAKGTANYGFVDTKGNITIPLIYQFATRFSEGLAPVKKDNKWGYINKKNEPLIPFQYDFAWSFEDGIAMVELDKKANTRQYINKEGKSISDIYDGSFGFFGGLANVQKKGKYGSINKKGQIVIPFEYDSIEGHFNMQDRNLGVIRVVKNGEKFYINKKNQRVNVLE